MSKAKVTKKDIYDIACTHQDTKMVRFLKLVTKKVTWARYVRIFCGIVAVLLLVIFVVKLARTDLIPDLSPQVILLSLAIAILLPYITSIEALGVKVGVKEQVEELSAWAKATPYYTLASEFEEAEDYNLAEKYYQKSLEECAGFWPSIFGLGSIYHDMGDDSREIDDYIKSINYYKKTIELDNDNLYSHNNLAAVYLDAPEPIYSPQKALECANKALEIMPSFTPSIFYRDKALANLVKSH